MRPCPRLPVWSAMASGAPAREVVRDDPAEEPAEVGLFVDREMAERRVRLLVERDGGDFHGARLLGRGALPPPHHPLPLPPRRDVARAAMRVHPNPGRPISPREA